MVEILNRLLKDIPVEYKITDINIKDCGTLGECKTKKGNKIVIWYYDTKKCFWRVKDNKSVSKTIEPSSMFSSIKSNASEESIYI